MLQLFALAAAIIAAVRWPTVHTTVLVEVQLLGRSGLEALRFEHQLASVKQDGQRIGVVEPNGGGASLELDVTSELIFRVSQAPSALSRAVKARLAGGDTISSPAVVELLETAAQRGSAHTLFLLDFEPAVGIGAAASGRHASPCLTPCAEPALGASRAQRALWIDLAACASLPPYGSLGRGGGAVDLRHALGAAATPTLRSASVAALVHRAARVLLAPPVHTFPVRFHSTIVVQVFSVASASVPDDAAARSARSARWRAVERELRAVALAGQSVRLDVQHRALAECAACRTALTRAARTRRAHFAAAATSPGMLRLTERDEKFLDAGELRRALAELDAEHRSIVAVNSAAARGTGGDLRVVPVFLFHLGADTPTLLDGTRVARGFDDMVLAVRLNDDCGARRPVAASAELLCGAGRAVGVDASGARRATLAVLLQRIWGVASTRVAWDTARGALTRDELWR